MEAPTLLQVGGEDHPLLRRTAQALHERIAHARLAVLPDCRHLANMEQPELFNQLVLEFLKGVTHRMNRDLRRRVDHSDAIGDLDAQFASAALRTGPSK